MKVEVSAHMDKKIEIEKIQNNLHKALYMSVVKLKELAIRNAPSDIGLLRVSINFTPNTKTSDKYILSDNVPYGIFVEYGTRPHWVPIKPLIAWAKRHKGDEDFAYAIRGYIAKHGINAHPFFRPAIQEVRSIWIPYYFNTLGVSV